MENVTISLEVLADLLRKAERINTLERLFETNGYIGIDDVKAVLDIKRENQDG